MSLVTRELDDAVVLHPSGRITAGHGGSLVREVVQTAIDRRCHAVVIDLHDVSALDSGGIGELVAAHLRLQSLGGRLVLTGLSPKVTKVLLSMSLTDLFEIHDDLRTIA